MATIPAGVILIWSGTHAGIPSGWQRETAFDDKHLKAWGTEDPNDTGGSNTHTHDESGHTHTLDAHTHAVVLANYSGSPSYSNRNDNVADNHGHVSANIGGTSGGTLQNESVEWSSVNHEPPYNEVIFIKPSGGAAPISDDVIVFWNSASAPPNFNFCDGDNGTTDLRNKYLKGAATDGDAGGSGGATSHQHTVTHGHTATGHTHSGASGARDNSGNRGNASVGAGAHQTHKHTVTLNSTTANVNNYTKTDAGSGDSIDLVHHRLALVQNTSGGSLSSRLGMIGLWLGAVGSIPQGWDLCDGNNDTPNLQNKYLKVINTTGQIGDTGGSNTHTHSAVSHTHTATGTHTHSGSTGTATVQQNYDSGSDGGSPLNHTHSLDSVSSETATFSTDDLDSGPAVNHEPAYRVAAFIQLNQIFGGGFFAGLMASSG